MNFEPLGGHCIRRIVTIDQTMGARLGSLPQIQNWRNHDARHEFVAKLAYKLWEQRGRPLGSPDADWFAAEQAVYASLAASGMITPSPNDPQNMREEIYR